MIVPIFCSVYYIIHNFSCGPELFNNIFVYFVIHIHYQCSPFIFVLIEIWTYSLHFMASYTLLSSNGIHNMLDDQIVSLSNPWTATILFPVFAVLDMKLFPLNIFNSPPEEVDICKYLTAQQYPTKRLYFPPSKYQPRLNAACMQSK